MRVLLTGASSFTGFWFARALREAGHELVCPLRGNLEQGSPLRLRRIDSLRPICALLPSTPFGSDAFLELVGGEQFDLLCHHAAEVGNYKSDQFDVAAAVARNTHNLSRVLDVMRGRGLKGVVLTGTYFEEGEGRGTEPLRAFSPYGRSKTETWDYFRRTCAGGGVPLGKFVIPNPFGAFEEPRFTGYLMTQWKAGHPAVVRTPDYVRDNMPVDLLARVYAWFAGQVAAGRSPDWRCNPSGYPESQREFAQRVAREVAARQPWSCQIEFLKQIEFPEPLRRVNNEPATSLVSGWVESAFWDEFVKFYCGKAS